MPTELIAFRRKASGPLLSGGVGTGPPGVGLPNDGKIYVSAVEDAIRIRTGERGEAAV
ncbi:P-II family nitrogen regulator [Verrucomicrobiota bacterium]